MTILGLDLSTRTGYAVVSDGVRLESGEIDTEYITVSPGDRDASGRPLVAEYEYIRRARYLANRIFDVFIRYPIDYVYIEQTNQGRNRTTQKELEFIHYAVLDRFCYDGFAHLVRYVDTSAWRSGLSIKLSKDQRKHNKAVKAKSARGKVTAKHLAVAWANEKFGLKLKLKDNNEAEAIALAAFGEHDQRSKVAPVVIDDINKTFQST